MFSIVSEGYEHMLDRRDMKRNILHLQDSIFYTLVGGGAGLNYFFIERDSGIIYLRKPLTDSTDPQFTVSSYRKNSKAQERSTFFQIRIVII